ncbi:murein L,D-transpeptidase [Salinimicrobium marinum]|uniref:Murein L,D-transpeptidase n=1 Tax=Salinimicrobium marinum TaxID=680283 RepID=A0A918S995_9FLAO|nr:L,D-transpeptidase family protein [Salinimicrobium marinum]GHA27560.1 murein L,D-transpeptidase [Salinimicrobium marinum]
MKKKINKYTYLSAILLLTLVVASCNNGSEGSENDDNSFFGNLFGNGAGEDIEISSEEISGNLKNIGNQLLNQKELENFYNSRSNLAVWGDAEIRRDFYRELKKSNEEGLQFLDYHGSELEDLMDDPGDLSAKEKARMELLLTDAFFEYASHLYYGKLDPKSMYEIWGVKRKQKDLQKLLQDVAENGNIEDAITDLKPKHQVYSDLKKALGEYEKLKEEDISIQKIPEGELIKPGDEDERIAAITERLKTLNFLDKDYTSEGNLYDERLQDAVNNFQHRKGLQTDAILGNSTIRELNMSPEDRYFQILANLERWRWYPRDLGEHYILINIPAYELTVVKGGETVREHKVIAGTKERPTPIFSDSLQYIVLNPEWNIPSTIKNEDVIPAASKNPDYLSSRNMSVLSAEGEAINPSSINWSGDEVQSYRFVQESGPANPLGKVKIIYPNDYAIYLHDTPSKDLFEQNERAASSGCVRVQDVLDLANYLLDGQEDWNMEKINETVASGETIQVPIKSPIRVHHFYWTAWRDNGNTVFTEDVYELDKEIYTALQRN